MSFLSKYLPLQVARTHIIFFQKLQCVELMPEKIEVPVERFLYSICVHIKFKCRSNLNMFIIHVLGVRYMYSFTPG